MKFNTHQCKRLQLRLIPYILSLFVMSCTLTSSFDEQGILSADGTYLVQIPEGQRHIILASGHMDPKGIFYPDEDETRNQLNTTTNRTVQLDGFRSEDYYQFLENYQELPPIEISQDDYARYCGFQNANEYRQDFQKQLQTATNNREVEWIEGALSRLDNPPYFQIIYSRYIHLICELVVNPTKPNSYICTNIIKLEGPDINFIRKNARYLNIDLRVTSCDDFFMGYLYSDKKGKVCREDKIVPLPIIKLLHYEKNTTRSRFLRRVDERCFTDIYTYWDPHLAKQIRDITIPVILSSH